VKLKKRRIYRKTISGLRHRDFRETIFSAISISWSELARLLARKNERRHSSRSRGYWHKAKMLFRFQEQNAAALDVDLSNDDLARIEEVASKNAFAGSRYPKAMLDLLNR